MEQHPVPQNIAAFKFKLFGSLTAKQFFTLIIPLSLAALIFFSGLPVLIRFPLSFILGTIAFVIALVPINGQSFDKWAVAFIKAVMAPTQRVWIKDKKIPDFLNVIVTPPIAEETIPEELSTQKKAKLFAYLKTLPRESATPIDVKEQIALKDIDFSAGPIASVETPQLQVRKVPPPIIWSTLHIQSANPAISTVQQTWETTNHGPLWPSTPPSPATGQMPPNRQPQPLPIRAQIKPKISPHAKPFVIHGLENRLAKAIPTSPVPKMSEPKQKEYVQLVTTPSVNLASDTNYSLDNIIPVKMPDNKIMLLHGIGKTRARKLHFAPPANFDLSKLPIRGEKRFEVSSALKRHFQFEDTSPDVILPLERKTAQEPPVPAIHSWQKPINMPTQIRIIPKSSPQASQPPAAATTAKAQGDDSSQKFSVTDLKKGTGSERTFTSAEIIPLTSTPNVISGLITDASGTPLAGAVIVVRDAFGIPVRALKTNKLGQFLSATPLATGTYTIETESETATFKPLNLDLKDQIVPPIAIAAEQQTNHGPK